MYKKSFTTLQKSLITGSVLIFFGAIMFLSTAFGGTKFGMTLNLASTAGGLDYGLVGHWTFDGKDMPNGQVNDTSGQGNNGSMVSMSTSTAYTKGVIGQGLRVNGNNSTEGVQVSDFNSISAYPVTLSAWTRALPGNNGSGRPAVSLQNTAGTNYYIIGMSDTNGTPVLAANNGGGFKNINASAVGVGVWTHLVGVFSSATDRKLYVNGVLAVSDTVSVSSITPTLVKIARGFTGSPSYFDFDDARVYNRALSDDEIKQLYQLGATTKVATTPSPSSRVGGLDYGLVGHWTFDGKDMPNGQVNDTSGQGNNGSMVSMATSTAYVRGAIGQALKFNGVDSYVKLGAATNLVQNTTASSVSVWARARVGSSGTRRMVGISDGLTTSSRFSFLLAGSDRLTAIVKAQDADGGFTISSTDPVTETAQWHHYVAVVVYATDSVQLYRDGVLVPVSSSPTFAATQTSNTSPTVANVGTGPATSNFWDGDLDDARVYNRALSLDEIKQLYQLGATTHISSTPSPSPTQGGLDYGLVGHWTFDGKDMPSGQVNDTSGQGNNGSMMSMSTSTAYTRGAIGQGLAFDGVDDQINLTASTALDLDANYTLSAWVKHTKAGAASVIVKRGAASASSNRQQYRIAISSSNVLQFTTSDGTTGDIDSYGSITPGQWTHVLCTHGAEGGAKTCYLDGVQSGAAATDDQTVYIANEGKQSIGADDNSGANFMGGAIDDVRTYNRVLSPDEIKQLYQMGKPD